MSGELWGAVSEAAHDLGALTRTKKIAGLTRAERKAAIEAAQTKLHRAVDDYAHRDVAVKPRVGAEDYR